MMRNKTMKGAVMALLAGGLTFQWGCLNWSTILQASVYYAGFEFLADNDGIFDLFADDDDVQADDV